MRYDIDKMEQSHGCLLDDYIDGLDDYLIREHGISRSVDLKNQIMTALQIDPVGEKYDSLSTELLLVSYLCARLEKLTDKQIVVRSRVSEADEPCP